MSPNLRRYLPFMIGALALVILISALANHRSSGSASSSQSTATLQTLDRVTRAENLYHTAHGRYTSQVADLLTESRALGGDIVQQGFVIQLNVSSDGQTYYALVQSPVLSVLSAYHDRTLLTENCVVLKSGSGVACPAGTTPSKTTT
jgi:hypothetical protein